MQSMTLYLRDAEIVLHCSGCARDFPVDANKPFVPQLRAFSYDHHCASGEDWDDDSTVLASLTKGQPQAL